MTKTSAVQAPKNYWVARIEADAARAAEEARAARRAEFIDSGDIWFLPGVALWYIASLVFAWAPTIAHGWTALGYSVGWSVFFAIVVAAAILDTRRDRSIFS